MKPGPTRSLQITLDRTTGIPAYVQIMLQVQGQILRGELQPGDQLPTVRSLAAALALNFNTVARAYRRLDRAGLISTQQGRGTYARDTREAHNRLRADVLNELTDRFLGELERLEFDPSEAIAALRHLSAQRRAQKE